jgi:phosphatidylserine decarboxylase
VRTLAQHLLPHKIISKIAYLCATCKIICIKNYLIRYFLSRYNVNMSEAIQENPLLYPTYNDFFTRKLKPECRPVDSDPNAIVSPADGAIAQIGKISNNEILQAKGHNYTVQSLLGDMESLAAPFINGSFATIYLAPKDYHRVHMPLTGKLQKMIYIPGKLFSVNNHAAENIPNVFARNERVVAIFETDIGSMAVILVGAMIVGSIATSWAGTICPPHTRKIKIWDYNDMAPIKINKGDEMGLFKLGSTVIILHAPNAVNWNESLTPATDVKMGSRIGLINTTR